jgi:hypothetical protein
MVVFSEAAVRGARMNACRQGICQALMLVMLSATAAIAQEKPLVVESSTIQPSVALGRPMLSWWDVKIRGSGLLTGKIQFLLKSENQLLAIAETEDLTLNGPEQRIRVLLPAIDPGLALDRINVQIAFQGKNFSGTVSDQILRIPFSTKKVFVGLVGESRLVRKNSPKRAELLDNLKFENLLPNASIDRKVEDDQELLKTFFAMVDPTDFPAEPMSYCSYDLVVLTGDEFRTLRKAQLEALLAWIKAGGSLYVEPNGVLEAWHVDFLKGLVEGDPQQLVIQPDSTGKILPETIGVDQPVALVQCGIGLGAIRIDDAEQSVDFGSTAWGEIAHRLWRFRQNLVPRPDVTYSGNGQNGEPVSRPSQDPWGLMSANSTPFRISHGELLEQLMPARFRMVPAWLLTLILVAFVVLIGPVDYFVLGFFRARNLTWLTFPLATIAVTALTVWLSNSYMAEAETRRAVVLCDIGPKGQIVRTNRFELLLTASTRAVTTEIQKGLFAPLKLSSGFDIGGVFIPGSGYQPARWMGQRGQMSNGIQIGGMQDDDFNVNESIAPFEGRIPTLFAVKQKLTKWTPQLNRHFSIPGRQTDPQIDWSEFDLRLDESRLIQSHAVPTKLGETARRLFGPGALVACFAEKDGWAYDRLPGWRSARTSGTTPTPFGNVYPQFGNARFGVPLAYGEADLFRWIYQASVAMPGMGIFTLTKQASPKGGAVCDDVPLLDASDKHSWLLVIVVPEGDDYIVYRKLMRFQ